MATSDLLDHGRGVEEGGEMGQGVLSWWLTIIIIGCRGNCIRMYKLRQYNNIVVIIVQPLISMVTAYLS